MTTAGADTERAMLQRLRAGDEAAFEALVSAHQGRLLRVARLFLSSPAAAEEAVQETWLAAIKGLAGFQGRSSLKTWITSILANRARTRAVREGRYVPLEAAVGEGDGEPAVPADRFHADGRWASPPSPSLLQTPEELLLGRETRAVLEAALGELPPGPRAVVTLRDVEGFDAAEACNILGISETNQRVLLHRGRSRLRDRLDEHLKRR
jgi:RNA polymerase sigma-70 factor (ECF subfamily)